MSSNKHADLIERLDYPLHDNWCAKTMKEAAEVIRNLQMRNWELEGGGPCLKCGTVLSELRQLNKNQKHNLEVMIKRLDGCRESGQLAVTELEKSEIEIEKLKDKMSHMRFKHPEDD